MSTADLTIPEFKRISVRDLNKSQRRAVSRIYRQYVERVRYTGCTSVRFELKSLGHGLVSMTVDTRRSDCEKSSQRQIFCRESFHGIIRSRGAITVCRAECGLTNNEAHIAFMVRGKTSK